MSQLNIRLIAEKDSNSALALYEPFVLNTSISFEYDVPGPEEFSERIKSITIDYPWLVCMDGDEVIGYAYASKHRYRTAYQWTTESTVYVSPAYHGKGIGRILYETLFEILRLQGYYNVFAGVAIPNKKSEGFHTALGFEEVGVFKYVGYKLGAWHSTKWFQKHLLELDYPVTPKLMAEIEHTREFKSILEMANMDLQNG